MICFENWLGVPYSHRQSGNRMMNLFTIVNITPTRKKEGLPSPFSLARNRLYAGTHLKEELNDVLKATSGIPYSPTQSE